MTSVQRLQLDQPQLCWEVVPAGLGTCLWGFLTVLPEAHLRGHTDAVQEGLALSLQL